MIDLHETYCNATVGNYRKLIEINPKLDLTRRMLFFTLREINKQIKVKYVDESNLEEIEGLKQIHLVNGQFEYVEENPKNNFKEYGFEGDFVGEILKEVDNFYIGYAFLNNEVYACRWNTQGYEWESDNNEIFELTQIKEPWYEDEESFPCILRKKSNNKLHIGYYAISSDTRSGFGYVIDCGCFHEPVENFELATKEEVLQLVIED